MLTLMRLNTKWSAPKTQRTPSVSDSYEASFVSSFRHLNEYLEGRFDLNNVDCIEYLSPFYQIITSESASGPLTCAALSSLVKFLLYGFLSPKYPNMKHGMHLIASSISQCIFEETDWENDEIILMKLLELSHLAFICDASSLLSVKDAWDIFGTCISIQSQNRASKILRSEAETALRHLTLASFSKSHAVNFGHLESETEHLIEDANDFGFSKVMKDKSWDTASETYLFDGVVGTTLLLGKLMSVLSELIDLQIHSIDRVKFALSLINIALEAGGPSLGRIGPLVDILKGDVCRHLLRSTQSDDLVVFSLALRVVFNLFVSIKDHMKIQLEVFFISVHLRILSLPPSPGLPNPKQELTLESLLEFCREPLLMQDLYINYDCDVQCTNLFDNIVGTLCFQSLSHSFKSYQELNDCYFQIDLSSVDSEVKKLSSVKVSFDPKNSSVLSSSAFEGLLSILHSIRNRIFDDKVSIHSNDTESILLYDPRSLFADNSNADSTSFNRQHSLLAGSSSVFSISDVDSSSGGSPISRRQSEKKKYGDDDCQNSIDLTNSSDCDSNAFDDEESEFIVNSKAKTAEVLRQRKLRKQKIGVVVEKFNKSPLKVAWLKYGLDVGILSFASQVDDHPTLTMEFATQESLLPLVDVISIAKFLRTAPGLDKKQIGELIGKGPADRYPYHALILRAYVNTFDFSGIGFCNLLFFSILFQSQILFLSFLGVNAAFDRALRLFLGSFHLPGEAQCIDRIMESFALKYFEETGVNNPFKSSDAVFILAFSTIMLNTDLHNPQIASSRKMSK